MSSLAMMTEIGFNSRPRPQPRSGVTGSVWYVSRVERGFQGVAQSGLESSPWKRDVAGSNPATLTMYNSEKGGKVV